VALGVRIEVVQVLYSIAKALASVVEDGDSGVATGGRAEPGVVPKVDFEGQHPQRDTRLCIIPCLLRLIDRVIQEFRNETPSLLCFKLWKQVLFPLRDSKPALYHNYVNKGTTLRLFLRHASQNQAFERQH
jgi:hypothetical protein